MTHADKPYAPACERNRDPILDVLRTHFSACRTVLEIGSGTGQHAVHFAAALPQLEWQCSDRAPHLVGIQQWLDDAALPNTPAALELDVGKRWPESCYDAVFSANTLHIMGWDEVKQLFAHLPALTTQQAVLTIYGPFKYSGRHTSASNAAFERSLMASAPHRAIRDFDDVNALARAAGFELVEDRAMPANNRCLVWRRTGG